MASVSLHEDFSRTHQERASSDRAFGVVIALAFSLAGLSPLRHRQPVRGWALAAAGVFLVVALARPSWLQPLNRMWTNLGLLMARIVNPVVTGLLFFAVVTPTSFLFRLLGKDPLRLANDPAVDSYWIPRHPPGPAPGTMTNQF